MADNPLGAYRVVYFQQTIDFLRSLGETATRQGIRGPYRDCLTFIQDKLKNDPLAWGDPLYRYPQLQLVQYHAIHSYLYVSYAVDEANRLVYVRDVKPLPSKWLE